MLDLKEAAQKATDTAHSQTLDLIDAQNKAVTTTFERLESLYGELSQNLPDITALTGNFKNPLETLKLEDFKVEPMSYDTSFKLGLASFALKGGFNPLADAPQLDELTPQATLSLAGKDYTLDELKTITPDMSGLTPKNLKPVPASYDASWIFGMGAYTNAFSFEPLENMPELDAYMPSLSFTKGQTSYSPADVKSFFAEHGEMLTDQIESFQDSYGKALNSFAAKAEDAAKEVTAELTKQINAQMDSVMKALPAFENFDVESFFSAFMPAAKPATKTKKATKKATQKLAKTPSKPSAEKLTKKVAPKKAAPKPTSKVELEPAQSANIATPPMSASIADVSIKSAPTPASQKADTQKTTDKYVSYLAKVAKYDAEAAPDHIKAIVNYCGIALSTRDGQLVACTDPLERAQVRDGFLTKKLNVTGETAQLDAKVLKVCEMMKASRFKDRVTFYYLLAKQEGKLGAL